MDDDTRRLLEEAHKAEQRGEHDAAVRGYLRAGNVDEAVRILVGAQRYLTAGQVMLRALGVAPSKVSALDAAGRQRARTTAQLLARGGDVLGAAELYAALNEHARGIDILERAGDHASAASLRQAMERRAPWEPRRPEGEGPVARAQALEALRRYDDALRAYEDARRPGDAARMAVSLGRWTQAGELYLSAANPYDASKCFARAGDVDRTLAALVMVPHDHPGYRKSAVRAASVAAQKGSLDYALDRFVAPFVATRPESPEECDALYLLARLFHASGHVDAARDAYARLVAADPRHRDAATRLAQLRGEAPRAGEPPQRSSREVPIYQADVGARVSLPDPLPDLPELPPLPAAPPPPPKASPPEEASAPTMATGPRPTPAGERGEEALVPGDTINARYRVEARIGQGGMATVYRAWDLELEERVALKVFGLALDDPQLVQRFKQEVTLSRQLTHPNIVRLHDLGLWSGRRFITMELLEGQSLTDWMRATVPVATGLRVMLQACTALGVAHQAGVVHRDVKPDNFFVTRAGIVKLMDFGIAKRRTEPTKTVAGFTAGTPAYIAPEQISDFTGATHLADLYAVGAMMYELFTGRLPFDHDDLMRLLMAHVNDAPTAPREHRGDLPEELDALILQLLAKDPAARPQSAEEVVRRLRAILGAVAR